MGVGLEDADSEPVTVLPAVVDLLAFEVVVPLVSACILLVSFRLMGLNYNGDEGHIGRTTRGNRPI